jgi:hypothetical protein
MRRPRGPGGRFLTAEEIAAQKGTEPAIENFVEDQLINPSPTMTHAPRIAQDHRDEYGQIHSSDPNSLRYGPLSHPNPTATTHHTAQNIPPYSLHHNQPNLIPSGSAIHPQSHPPQPRSHYRPHLHTVPHMQPQVHYTGTLYRAGVGAGAVKNADVQRANEMTALGGRNEATR